MPTSLFSQLAPIADTHVENTLNYRGPSMVRAPRTEVGFVAAIVHNAVLPLVKAWQPHLKAAGLRLSVTAVFCHGAPVVEFRNPATGRTRCELADLLLVVDDHGGSRIRRRASLIQAKMANMAGHVQLTGLSSRNQLALYQQWFVFDFVEAAYGLKGVDLRKGGTVGTATFGVIDRHLKHLPTNPIVWTQHAPSPTPQRVLGGQRLGSFLTGMVCGRPRLGRRADPSAGTPWSRTVEALLSVTYSRVFRHTPTYGPLSLPRGVTAFHYLSLGDRRLLRQGRGGSLLDGGPPDGVTLLEGDDQGGISTIHIRLERM